MPPQTIENPAKVLADVQARATQLQNQQNTRRQERALEPTVSANDLATPTTPITPPPPQVNTNDGSRLNGLIGNVANNTQTFIQAQTEEAARAREIADLLGNQTFDGAGERERMGREFGLPQNLARLQDIQTLLAQKNTASAEKKVNISTGAGRTELDVNRVLDQEDRKNAVRTAGLAAEAAVLQGNIETASTLVSQAMNDYYADRQLRNQNMLQQLNYFQGIADEQTSQLLKQEERKYQEDQANITRAQSLVDAAVSAGHIGPNEIEGILAITDPVVQANTAQFKIAQAIKRQMDADAAAAAAGGVKAPELKNFGSTDNPVWKQWNSQLGTWEDVIGLSQTDMEAEQAKQTTAQIEFLLDTTARILGDEEKGYDALYKAAAPNATAEFLRRNIGSASTNYTQLEAYAETLRVNVLTLMSDPNIRKFFGPQMTDRDAQFMMSAGSTLNVKAQTPEQIKQEVERMETILSQMNQQAQTLANPVRFNTPLAPNETIINSPIGPVIITD